ncbi:hypothetical protein BMS3Bbin14_00459 [bacterium BMS3Bbin14]|nr:hypothetical protein BMS3Abin13_00470 [bacterium BMS3Abin13]GBE52001.1 hypothetical protein BMS3Bbin14_00459 [bacterium BMS3Bbin14]
MKYSTVNRYKGGAITRKTTRRNGHDISPAIPGL